MQLFIEWGNFFFDPCKLNKILNNISSVTISLKIHGLLWIAWLILHCYCFMADHVNKCHDKDNDDAALSK